MITMGFDTDPLAFIDLIERDYHKKYKQVCHDVLGYLQMFSPIDKGNYMNNHHVSFDKPDPKYILKERDQQSEVIKFFGGDQNVKIDSMPANKTPIVYIQNNVPYAGYLEFGTTKFAPFAVFSRAVAATVSVHK